MTEIAKVAMPQIMKQERRFVVSRVLGYGMVAAIVVSILFPLVPTVIWAFSFRWFYPNLFPSQLNLRAWNYVFSPAARAGEAAFAGVTIALAATVLSMVVGIPAGRALGLHKFRGKRLVQFLILAPVIVPGLAVVMGIHVAFIRFGLAAKVSGVTNAGE